MTSLPFPRWFRELSGVRFPTPPINRLPDFSKEVTTMNIMMLGIVLAMASASVELLAVVEPMSQISMILMSLIAGSGGLIVNIATFRKDEELCPRKIARQTLAALPTSAFLTPLATGLVAKWTESEVNLSLLAAMAFSVGCGGPYLLGKYGQQVADIFGSIGVSRMTQGMGGEVIDTSDDSTKRNIKEILRTVRGDNTTTDSES